MDKFKSAVFFILFLSSLTVILFNGSKPVSLFRNYVSEILKPVETVFSQNTNKFLFWKDAFLNAKRLKDLNSELTAENLELYGQLAKLSELKEENAFLKEKLNLADKNSWSTRLAKVIGRDFENNRSFLIDEGLSDGIASDMPVILSGGILVGKISEANYNTSKVSTIIDGQSKISAVTLNGNISGLARGLGSDLIFDLVSKDKKPEKGDILITSGADGLWPRGLILGRIGSVKSENSQIFNTADVELFADFRNFNDVFVILNNFHSIK